MSFLKEALVKIGKGIGDRNTDLSDFEASLPYNLTCEQLSRGVNHYRALGSCSGIIRVVGIVGFSFGLFFLGTPEVAVSGAALAATGHLLLEEARGRERVLRHLRRGLGHDQRGRVRFLV